MTARQLGNGNTCWPVMSSVHHHYVFIQMRLEHSTVEAAVGCKEVFDVRGETGAESVAGEGTDLARCCLEFGMADASTVNTSREKQMGLKSWPLVIRRSLSMARLDICRDVSV